MLIDKFDAYGEVSPDATRGERAGASVIPSRIGQCVFWMLVAIIVSARIILYPATRLSKSAGQATETRGYALAA